MEMGKGVEMGESASTSESVSGDVAARDNGLVIYVSFPFALKSPAFGSGQPYIANSPAKAAYVDALERELASLEEDVRSRPVKAVRLGGGASIASADKVCKLVRDIRKTLAVQPRAEISIEVNPLTVGTPSLTDWTSCGINRVLLDARSVHDKELSALGVSHTRQDIENALQFLSLFKVARIDMRLLYGIPFQTLSSWKTTLLTVIDQGVEHITVLPLVNSASEHASEPASGPASERDAELPSAQEREQMRHLASEILGKHGYREYALGRFVRSDTPHAKDAFDAAVRAGSDQLGLGAAALSRYDGFVYENTGDFDRYVQESSDASAIVENPRRESPSSVEARHAMGAFDSLSGFSARREELAPETVAWLADLERQGLAVKNPSGDAWTWTLTEQGIIARIEQLGAAEIL